jgi:glycosyltransferase involved in cell wall biosynthesis
MGDQLKILMTADTVGGVWTYTMDLCRALEDYNVEIHLVTMGALLNNDQSKQVQSLKNFHLYESNHKLEWMHDPWEDVKKATDWLESIYRKVNPDLIHFNNFGQAGRGWDCPVVTVYHSCVQTWWLKVKGERAPMEWEKYTRVLEKALLASDIIVAPSLGMLQMAEEVFGKFNNSQVISNGRDLPLVNNNEDKEPYILSAGRVWDEAKNIRLLSEIACNLSWPVYIAGNNESPEGEIYQPENINFKGQLSQAEMEECMKKASVFVMPAKYEPFGLAVLEAAKAGCALALSDINTFREIWGDAAIYFNPANHEEAQQVIQNLIEDKNMRDEMAAKAVIRAKDFTAHDMAAKYMELYHELIESKIIHH